MQYSFYIGYTWINVPTNYVELTTNLSVLTARYTTVPASAVPTACTYRYLNKKADEDAPPPAHRPIGTMMAWPGRVKHEGKKRIRNDVD
jgi:hypothetical protein